MPSLENGTHMMNGSYSENGKSSKPNPRESLHIIDDRTGKYYSIPITRNSVRASDFAQIVAPKSLEYYADQNENGIRIYDPGFSNTAVSESKVTYIDGKQGKIQYRGYSIGDIVGKKGFIDTAYLLIWGKWPTKEEARRLQDNFNVIPVLDQSVFSVIKSLPSNGSPMGMMIAGLCAVQSTPDYMDKIPAHAAKNLYLGSADLVDQQIVHFMPNFAMVTAAVYCHHVGRPFTEPRRDLSYIENFLLMMGHIEAATGLPNPRYVSCFERLWVLIADHEMTCSTAALLQTASSLPDVMSCMVSAISAMYGPLHGGAIEVAYKNIEEIGSIENVPAKIEKVKNGKERLYGYGHRVYRVTDPRYTFIKEIIDELAEEIAKDPLLKVAFEVDRIAAEDEYFVSRNLKPNADLFAAFAYKAMHVLLPLKSGQLTDWRNRGFPPEFILPISLISRNQGFMAHWKEAMSGSARIWRPGQIYTGDLDKQMGE